MLVNSGLYDPHSNFWEAATYVALLADRRTDSSKQLVLRCGVGSGGVLRCGVGVC